MLFDTPTRGCESEKSGCESEKEKNLYSKFFIGYYMNELVEGYSQRISSLNRYLSKLTKNDILLEKPHVSIDNHAYLIVKEADRGEFADILIHDVSNKIVGDSEEKREEP